MFFLFSGEGPTDLGTCEGGGGDCSGTAFHPGPMAKIADQIVEQRQQYSLLDAQCYRFVSKGVLMERAARLKAAKKQMRLPGRKSPRETLFYFNNARVLASIAKEVSKDQDDEVVAILFRDGDGTASADRGHWKDKFQSMLKGFEEEGFQNGVPMLPKPKSEAWVICALKNSYQGCDSLEKRSGNDNSPNSLKEELKTHLGELPNQETLCEMVVDRRIDINRIRMPSFMAFRERLEAVI